MASYFLLVNKLVDWMNVSLERVVQQSFFESKVPNSPPQCQPLRK